MTKSITETSDPRRHWTWDYRSNLNHIWQMHLQLERQNCQGTPIQTTGLMYDLEGACNTAEWPRHSIHTMV